MQTYQYILLENYSIFQIENEENQELTRNFLRIIYKKENKYTGQAYTEKENIWMNRIKKETSFKYKITDERLKDFEGYYLESWKKDYNNEYNPKIGQACKKIFESRDPFHIKVKPLYLCKAELKEELAKEFEKRLRK